MNTYPVVSELRSALKKAGNPDYAIQMQKYMKSEMPYHGVKSAGQKEIYRTIFKKYPPKDFQEYRQVIEELWDAEFREERYGAIRYAKQFSKFQTMQALPLYRMMIEAGAWWDYVDSIAIDLIGSLLSSFEEEMKEELRRWITDEHLWIRRAAILSQLRFKKDTDHEMFFEFCSTCIHEKTFWMRKAIGWALRDYSKHEPDRVREFIEKNRENMSGLTLREASKYI